jgi:PhnB protein
MALRPNLMFAGNAESALMHYRAALGGDLEIVRFAGSPAAEAVPAEWGAKVLYGTLHSPFGEVNIMDAPPGREGKPGDNFAIAVDVDDEGLAADVFRKLGANGTVLMPLEPTFFARRFGMVHDTFGVRWMVNVPRPAEGAVR